jgi:hypothetical protein
MLIDILIDAADASGTRGTFMHELVGQVGIVASGGPPLCQAARDGPW